MTEALFNVSNYIIWEKPGDLSQNEKEARVSN
jgi:hypothetical protein